MDNGGCCHGGQTTDHCHGGQTVGPGSFWKSKRKTHRQSLLIANVNQGDLHCLTIGKCLARQKKRKTLAVDSFSSFVPGHEGLGGQCHGR